MLNGSKIDRHLHDDILIFLKSGVNMTGLTPISPFQVLDDAGLVMIAESHLSVHFKDGSAFVDVFSCRPFDTGAIEKLCQTLWRGEWSRRYLERSLESA